MKRFFGWLVLALMTCGITYAQSEPIRDTLDWRGYYPLQIGNVWELKAHVEGGGRGTDYILRYDIVGDTIIGGESHFIQVERLYSYFEFWNQEKEERHYLRHNDEKRIIEGLPEGPCDFGGDFSSSICGGSTWYTKGGYGGAIALFRGYGASPSHDTLYAAATKQFSGGNSISLDDGSGRFMRGLRPGGW